MRISWLEREVHHNIFPGFNTAHHTDKKSLTHIVVSLIFCGVLALIKAPFILLRMRFSTFSLTHKTVANLHPIHSVANDEFFTIPEHSETLVSGQKEKELNWLKKYQSYFVEEFIQGKADKNQILGNGVCYALGCRLASMMLENPHTPIEDVRIGNILPSDRFLQAATRIDFYLLNSMGGLPSEYLAKRRLKETRLSYIEREENMFSTIMHHLTHSQPENKILILQRAEHACVMRFDSPSDRFCFFDPNFGTLCFKRALAQSDQALISKMIHCWIDLYKSVYDPEETRPLLCSRMEKII